MPVTQRLEIAAKNGAVGYKSYPFLKDIPVNITYQLADVREPDKRKGSRSLTINLMPSNEINKLFENIYQVNVVTQSFNKNLKTPVKYFVNEELNFEGNLQLLRVTINPDKSINYECSIIGESGTLFLDIGDKYITNNPDSADDLDFSAYDHTFDRATQIASRSNWGTGLDVLYPFIDKGSNGGSDTVFDLRDFLPCFSKYEYVKKIIEATGRTYTSSILTASEFKKQITFPNIQAVPLTQTQIDNKQFYVGMNTDFDISSTTLYPTVGYKFTGDYPNESGTFFDIGGQYAGTVGTINQSGYFNLCASTKIKIKWGCSTGAVAYIRVGGSVGSSIQKSTDGGTTWIELAIGGSAFDPTPAPFWFDKGVDYLFAGEVQTGEVFLNAGDLIRNVVIVNPYQGALEAYDAAHVFMPIHAPITLDTLDMLSGAGQSSFYSLVTNKTLFAGDTCYVNQALPQKIKQKDYLKSIIQGLNLYIDIDPADKNNLIIESFEEFYDDGIVNFEGKIDRDKPKVINPNLLEGKRYSFSYKEDGDHYNTLYRETWGESFGTHIVDVDNDFIKEEKKTELIFSPTPYVANYGLGIPMPRIYAKDGIVIKPFTPNVRWLMSGGVKQTLMPYTYKEYGQPDLITYDYLHAGHTDDPFAPTMDLNFGVPKEVYYSFTGAYFTNNNLFNRYWANYLNNLIHRDAKFVAEHIWWNPIDIRNFSFRKKLFDGEAYYIVNKIANYTPLNETSTETELVKLLTADVFSPTSYLISSTPINAGNGVLSAKLNSSLNVGSSIQNRGANCFAMGENIIIGEGCSNVTVIGNNVVVEPGLSNINVINTSNIVVTQSNYSIVNSVVATDLFRTGEIETNDATPTKLLFDTTTGEFDVQQDQTMRIEVRVIATNQNGSRDSKEWVAQGVAEGQSPPTYDVVEAVTSTFSDASLATATFAIVATGTPGDEFLEFVVTGIAATDIKWKCQVEIVKIQN